MQTKTINLYEYHELSDKAKEKALYNFVSGGDDSYSIKVDIDNRLSDLLEDNKIKPAEYTQYAGVYFSLAHCQGDGVMFYGTFDWKNYRVYIKHSGRYYHSYSKTVEIQDQDNLGFDIDDDKVYEEFETMYQSICKELETVGYESSDYFQSAEHFEEYCNANEILFREDGTQEDA